MDVTRNNVERMIDASLDVVIVCNSTIATSKILESRLKSIFYNVNVVISTIPLESSQYLCVTVNPLLKLEEAFH